MRSVAGLLALLAVLAARTGRAVPVEDVPMTRTWRLARLRLRGNTALSTGTLRASLVSRPRPWYTPWRALPVFDPVAFRTDLERLHRLYESHGYYRTRIAYDLELPADDGDRLQAVVDIEEGAPVVVDRVDVVPTGTVRPPDPPASLPLSRGDVFTEDAYDGGLAVLRRHYRERGYARVTVAKSARIDVDAGTASVTYGVDSGPASVFGDPVISGNATVTTDVIRRELAFTPGAPFRQSDLERTHDNLAALNLFQTIRVEDAPGTGPDVDVRVAVVEAKPRQIQLGVGYDTEEEVRGLATWRHYNFLGGARQLGFTARLSLLNRTLTADFVQPHFPLATSRTRLIASEGREDEDAYRLDRTRLSPRLEWQPTATVTAFGFYRAEYDSLDGVSDAIKRRLPGAAPPNSVLSGLGLGADWTITDNLLDPTRGWVTNASVEPVGGALGGDVSFVRLLAEERRYQPLVGRLRAVARLRLGTAEPIAGSHEIPIFERFYVGGINSVRGYGRRRIGPLVDDEPIGGRSAVEASFELRHPIRGALDSAVFLDGGQVSQQSFDFPFTHLRYGSGVGARYRSPVGPLRLDLGFPLRPPRGDSSWQVYVSLGATF
jgi:outer membrane protein assembly complex protein YaeT